MTDCDVRRWGNLRNIFLPQDQSRHSPGMRTGVDIGSLPDGTFRRWAFSYSSLERLKETVAPVGRGEKENSSRQSPCFVFLEECRPHSYRPP